VLEHKGTVVESHADEGNGKKHSEENAKRVVSLPEEASVEGRKEC